jgi:hypothetical protein
VRNPADKPGPRHVHGPVDIESLRSRIVLEDFRHQGRVVRRWRSLIDPVGAKLINAFPLPNLNAGSPVYNPYGNFVTTGSSPLHPQSFDIRLDRHFSEKDTQCALLARVGLRPEREQLSTHV